MQPTVYYIIVLVLSVLMTIAVCYGRGDWR